MKRLFIISLVACISNSATATAQETEIDYTYPSQVVAFLSIYETDSFEEAQTIAKQAADSLNTDFSNTYLFDKEVGLIDTSHCGCGEQHGYIGRGRFDEGDYVSIELNSWYEFETVKPVYTVVVLSSPSSDPLLREKIKNIKRKYSDSIYFEEEVYTGCMH